VLNRLESEQLAFGGNKKLFDILSADTKATSIHASHHLKRRGTTSQSLISEFRQMLHASYFITSSAVVFGQLGFKKHGRLELVRHQEVGSLIHVLKSFSNTCLMVRNMPGV